MQADADHRLTTDIKKTKVECRETACLSANCRDVQSQRK